METLTKMNLSVKFNSDVNFDDYKVLAENAVAEIKERKGKSGQFLNWIGVLQENQIKNIDVLYSLFEKAKKGGFTDLAILGIGGATHTTNSFSQMLGGHG